MIPLRWDPSLSTFAAPCSPVANQVRVHFRQLTQTLIGLILLYVTRKHAEYIKGPLKHLLTWRLFLVAIQVTRSILAISITSFGRASLVFIFLSYAVTYIIYSALVVEAGGAFTKLIPPLLIKQLPSAQQRFCFMWLYRTKLRRLLLIVYGCAMVIGSALMMHFASSGERDRFVQVVSITLGIATVTGAVTSYMMFVVVRAFRIIISKHMIEPDIRGSSHPSHRRVILTTRLNITQRQIQFKLVLAIVMLVSTFYNAAFISSILDSSNYRIFLYVMKNIILPFMQVCLTLGIVYDIHKCGSTNIFQRHDSNFHMQGNMSQIMSSATRGNSSRAHQKKIRSDPATSAHSKLSAITSQEMIAAQVKSSLLTLNENDARHSQQNLSIPRHEAS